MKIHVNYTDHLPTFDEKLAALKAVDRRRATVSVRYRPKNCSNRRCEDVTGTVIVHRNDVIVTVGNVDHYISDVICVEADQSLTGDQQALYNEAVSCGATHDDAMEAAMTNGYTS